MHRKKLHLITSGNSPEVANWVIMVMFRPRAEHDHDNLVGEEGGKEQEGGKEK